MKFFTWAVHAPFFGILLVSILFINACSGTAGDTTGTPQTGGVAFTIQYHPSNTGRAMRRPLFNCGDGADQVRTVTAIVYERTETGYLELAGNSDQPWSCETGSGTLAGIKAGTERIICVYGKNSDNQIIARGSLSDVTIRPGQTEPVGTVDTYRFLPEIRSPLPADGNIVQSSTVPFQWYVQPEAGAVSYTLQISGDAAFPPPLLLDESFTTTTLGWTPPANNLYYWRVQAVDGMGVAGDWTSGRFTFDFNYTVTVSPAQYGVITPAGDSPVAAGEDLAFTISPDPGFFLSALYLNATAIPVPSLTQLSENAFRYVIADVQRDYDLQAVFERVWYVDRSAAGAATGESWENAFVTVRAAVTASAWQGGEIWVKGATYPLTIPITFSAPIELYGHFSGNEFHPSQRDFSLPANETILNGNSSTHCLEISDTTGVFIDGIVIENGARRGDVDLKGGGVSLINVGARFVNCSIRNNQIDTSQRGDGGGIYMEGGSVAFTNCTISSNQITADNRGYGGGINNTGGTLSFSGCVFEGNRIDAQGNFAFGGAVHSTGPTAFQNCTFTQNSIFGALSAGGGAIRSSGTSDSPVDLAIDQCFFIENQCNKKDISDYGQAGYGGAVYTSQGNLVIGRSVFIGNRAVATSTSHGGALYEYDSNITLTNVIFAGNSVEHTGSSGTTALGGAIYNRNGSSELKSRNLINCTIVDNTATGNSATPDLPAGGGIYSIGTSTASCDSTMTNSIAWGNETVLNGQITVDQLASDAYANIFVSYCDLDPDEVHYIDYGNNLYADPELDADYHLLATSPCLDSGNADIAPDEDIDGDLRPYPVGGAPDMGADEYAGP